VSRAAALLPPDDPRRIDLIPNVRAVQGMSDLGWADTVLSEAMAAGNPRLTAHALVQKGLLRLFTGSNVAAPEVEAVARRAISGFVRLGDELGLARAWRLLAQTQYLARQAEPSAESAERALTHARNAGDRFEEREIVEWLGVALLMGPIPAPVAANRCERLLASVAGDSNLEINLLGALAHFEAIQGRGDKALSAVARGEQLLRDLGGDLPWMFPVYRAFTALSQGDPAAAERQLIPGYEQLKTIGEKSHFCSVATLLAQASDAQAHFDQVEKFAGDAERAARPNDVYTQIVWRRCMAKILTRRGDLVAGERLAREAVAIGEESDFLSAHGDSLMDLGEILDTAGRRTDAEAAVRAALSLQRQKVNLLAVERAEAVLDGFSPPALLV
jgi:ATP/maltotriose-dependent transcriptional regulator MalT